MPPGTALRGTCDYSGTDVLESPGLLIAPWERCAGRPEWSHAVRPGEWARPLHEKASGQLLGFAAWQNAGSGLFASWFGRRQITLYETEDASLLLTLRRGFWRIWEVFDAEERPVGSIYRNALLRNDGETLACIRKPVPAIPGGFFNQHHQDLASFAPNECGGWALTFPHSPPTGPFTRMVLLATVLSWPPEPG